jgi:bifunctional UDP-N-acetylglucosamine pyrophosphorylase/glucosamine-1-phosphate N-acetyltransferase
VTVCAVVPAAGRGSRLGLDGPKILVPVDAGVTVWDMLRAQLAPHVDRLHVVVSPAGEPAFAAAVAGGPAGPPVSVSVQPAPTGMGDAILGCAPHWDRYDTILVVWGDQVHVSGATVAEVLRVHAAGRGPRCTIPLVRPAEPYVEYRFDGRTLTEVRQSREGDECAPGGLADVGVFALSTAGLSAAWSAYAAAGAAGGVTGEVNFLPFLPYLSGTAGWPVRPVEVADPDEARGINTPADLEFARARLRSRR